MRSTILALVIFVAGPSVAFAQAAPMKGEPYRVLIEAEGEDPSALAMFDFADLPHSDVAADAELARILATDPDSLIDIICSSVGPNFWSRVNGPGEIFSLGDRLVVKQDHECLKMIADLLAALRKARDVSALSKWGAPALTSIGVGEDEGAAAAARKVMRTWIDLQMDERLHGVVPLAEAAAAIAKKAGIRIDVDNKAINDAGLGADVPVTLPLRRGSLEAILAHLSMQIDMTFEFDGNAILVARPECPRDSTRLYPAIDLMRREAPDRGEPSLDDDSIIELVNGVIELDPWHERNDPANGTSILGAIAFTQSEEVHEEIELLFAALRLAKRRAEEKAADSTAPIIFESDEDEAMRKCLSRGADFAFDAVPASDMARILTEKYGLPFLVDERAFEDAGLPLDLPITGQAKGGPLGDVLRRLLAPHELDIGIWYGVAFITTVERYEESPVVAVYPVHDLAPITADVSLNEDRLRELEESVRSVGGRGAWEKEGGPGAAMSFGDPRVLVVKHSETMHAQVAALLAKLRAEAVTLKP